MWHEPAAGNLHIKHSFLTNFPCCFCAHVCLLQLAAAGAERDSLAQQNAALASVLGKTLGAEASSSSAAASADRAQGGVGPRTPAQSETGGAAASGAAAAGGGAVPTPAQMKEIGVLMQRLTRENAALIKARWADICDREQICSWTV